MANYVGNKIISRITNRRLEKIFESEKVDNFKLTVFTKFISTFLEEKNKIL